MNEFWKTQAVPVVVPAGETVETIAARILEREQRRLDALPEDMVALFRQLYDDCTKFEEGVPGDNE